ncbi:GSH-induced LITAF domain protein [Cocos nucifera]|uniref:GSH-induced LITAF domain protein n=1 Tax=Cocos nucifera TaxID=13894 RepID=A0A8K0I0I4_COCNU|nr:GSH-induced LITAF domain protein [Cocos nucifera]
MATKGEGGEPALGVPYGYAASAPQRQGVPYGYTAAAPQQQGVPYGYAEAQPQQAQVFYVGQNPYQAGMIPPNAIYGDPMGIPLQQTMFRDTPAPFQCVYCGLSGLTTVKSKPSLAAVVACMMPFMLGVCFLCPSMDCLWHKYHYCPSCGQKVAEYEKSDPCLVVDAPRWREKSFAVPA